MRKLVYSLVAVMVLASTTVFAQEDMDGDVVEFGEVAVSRSLRIYLDATSGVLTPSANTMDYNYDDDNNLTSMDGSRGAGYFAGSEFEVGAFYTQDFGSVKWLSLYVGALAVINPTWYYQ